MRLTVCCGCSRVLISRSGFLLNKRNLHIQSSTNEKGPLVRIYKKKRCKSRQRYLLRLLPQQNIDLSHQRAYLCHNERGKHIHKQSNH